MANDMWCLYKQLSKRKEVFQLKKIISKTTAILGMILLSVSICGISSVNCLKGYCPLQNTIILNKSIMHSLNIGDISSLPYNSIPLFYVALGMVILSGIICIKKANKVRNLIFEIMPLFLSAYVLISHNYIWFMILINIYFLLYTLSNITLNNKTGLIICFISIVITVINFAQLFSRLNMQFNINEALTFSEKIIKSSNLILKAFILWTIPYLTLLVDNIVKNLRKEPMS